MSSDEGANTPTTARASSREHEPDHQVKAESPTGGQTRVRTHPLNPHSEDRAPYKVWAFSALPPTTPRHPLQKNLYEAGGMYISPRRDRGGDYASRRAAEHPAAVDEEVETKADVKTRYKGLLLNTKSKQGRKRKSGDRDQHEEDHKKGNKQLHVMDAKTTSTSPSTSGPLHPQDARLPAEPEGEPAGLPEVRVDVTMCLAVKTTSSSCLLAPTTRTSTRTKK